MPGKKQKKERKSQKGIPKRDSWVKVIKPNLDEVLRLYSHGATKAQIVEFLGIGHSTFAEMEAKHPELTAALARARMKACDEVRGAMFKKAVGYQKERVRTQLLPVVDENGKIKKDADGKPILKPSVTKVKIDVEPDVSAQLAFLKNVGGWSDNPVLDNALAKNAEADAETRRKMLESLGMRDFSKPRSTEKDIHNRDEDVVSDSDLDAMGV